MSARARPQGYGPLPAVGRRLVKRRSTAQAVSALSRRGQALPSSEDRPYRAVPAATTLRTVEGRAGVPALGRSRRSSSRRSLSRSVTPQGCATPLLGRPRRARGSEPAASASARPKCGAGGLEPSGSCEALLSGIRQEWLNLRREDLVVITTDRQVPRRQASSEQRVQEASRLVIRDRGVT